MKTNYEHMQFKQQIVSRLKTSVWECRGPGPGKLGEVKWYSPWRRYCFWPNFYKTTIFDAACLSEIQAFINQLMEMRKQGIP
jgi:hypothetical protein